MEKDFFISYAPADHQWAEWIAWHLEREGFSTIIPSWDFVAGRNFVVEMDRASKEARRIVVVLSNNYLEKSESIAEWTVAFKRDPLGEHGILLPVCVQKCDVNGLLGALININLVDLDETGALRALLAGVKQERGMPTRKPSFPRNGSSTRAPRFPGALPPEDYASFSFPAVWNVPFQRNHFFTGREEELSSIHGMLNRGRRVAITGLGGIGKTQTAVEYAYRFASEYQAILWVRAESREMLLTDFSSLADILNLSAKEEREQNQVIIAVKGWLTEKGRWLLILDNSSDPQLVGEFLPPSGRGHILLTTRNSILGGLAQKIVMQKMGLEDGIKFLLRRIDRIALEANLDLATSVDRMKAEEVVRLMDGLPLALDQAGSYIEETLCSLDGYLQLYYKQRAERLKERGGLISDHDHPEPVATTWSLSFEKVKEANNAAAQLLEFFSFLSPDAIPQELLTENANTLGPALELILVEPSLLNKATRDLLAYSLIYRDFETQTFSVHRLVQVMLKDQMGPEMRRLWAERTVRAVNHIFPSPEPRTNWPRCRIYLSHAKDCASLIEQENLISSEAADLLNKLGYYFWLRGEFELIEPLYLRTLAIREKVLGLEHPSTLNSMDNLANLYDKQLKYEQAEPFYLRTLAIREQVHGPEHPETARSLNNLGALYYEQGRYAEAEPLYLRALAIREQGLDQENPDIAKSLVNLAAFYCVQGKYEQAEPLYLRALAICEKKLGTDHRDTARILVDLAILYFNQRKHEETEPFLKRALDIYEKECGLEHPYTVAVRRNYSVLREILQEKGG